MRGAGEGRGTGRCRGGRDGLGGVAEKQLGSLAQAGADGVQEGGEEEPGQEMGGEEGAQ